MVLILRKVWRYLGLTGLGFCAVLLGGPRLGRGGQLEGHATQKSGEIVRVQHDHSLLDSSARVESFPTEGPECSQTVPLWARLQGCVCLWRGCVFGCLPKLRYRDRPSLHPVPTRPVFHARSELPTPMAVPLMERPSEEVMLPGHGVPASSLPKPDGLDMRPLPVPREPEGGQKQEKSSGAGQSVARGSWVFNAPTVPPDNPSPRVRRSLLGSEPQAKGGRTGTRVAR